MASLAQLDRVHLQTLSIAEYFKIMESAVDNSWDLERWTDFFTIKPYTESRPYLVRRQLIPIDPRFSRIELVYEDRAQVQAIVWEISLLLSQIIEIFGEPMIQHVLHTESTSIGFRSENQCIEMISTHHPRWLTRSESGYGFEYRNDVDNLVTLFDPQVSFVHFSIKTAR